MPSTTSVFFAGFRLPASAPTALRYWGADAHCRYGFGDHHDRIRVVITPSITRGFSLMRQDALRASLRLSTTLGHIPFTSSPLALF